jgi:hypothetical protein
MLFTQDACAGQTRLPATGIVEDRVAGSRIYRILLISRREGVIELRSGVRAGLQMRDRAVSAGEIQLRKLLLVPQTPW